MEKLDISAPRKVALYAYIGSAGTTWTSLMEPTFATHGERYEQLPEGQTRELPKENFARVSEIMEITFSPLQSDEAIQHAVASLDAAERSAIEELNKKIASIRQQKAQLLALTHTPETV